MHLCYFDENKHTAENPHFFIGGLLIPDSKALEFEDTLAKIAFDFFGSSLQNGVQNFPGSWGKDR